MLSKRERKKIIEELKKTYPGFSIGKDVVVEIYEDRETGSIILFDNLPSFFKFRDRWIPHLKFLLKNMIEGLPVVVVDTGAVKPLLRGADLMAPGIRFIKNGFREGDPVVVVDEKYGKPFMIGIALIDSEKITSGAVKKGRVIKNIHRVGDKLWKLSF